MACENAKCGQRSVLDEIYLPLHRIIAFSNVEGQGNRTSIFLQGCKLNCLYCHNPETIARHSEQANAVSLRYLIEQVQHAMPFIRGVTVSGGEPTIHHRKLVPLFKALRAQGLTCYLDTSGFFDFEATRELIEETDKFLFDIKGTGLGLQQLCFDRQNRAGKVRSNPMAGVRAHIKPEHLARNMDNLTRLLPMGKIEEVRLVAINGFFDAHTLVHDLAARLKHYPEVLLKIIRVHAKGARDADGLTPFIPSTQEIDALAQHAKACGVAKVVTIY
ncbi:4Fe-4S cluster-binding domain-containing protein [Pasteurellaceae bacterium 20609_3]|uniref:4Fe-4S cluster-binding domain-containing protein n=1 Tax=Spirabiliibacterium mucosae TaxID=28156 RepID=UPI001AADFC4A|nr:4Fe-4S cluster-binding domain-containing protein [Spirabiliibacterium mucosae]MBE2898475.1 4Fe-4S cluster-binding domain-containing protein [Spirabiliibacterium mucosae]